jgi:hypothetical protein
MCVRPLITPVYGASHTIAARTWAYVATRLAAPHPPRDSVSRRDVGEYDTCYAGSDPPANVVAAQA